MAAQNEFYDLIQALQAITSALRAIASALRAKTKPIALQLQRNVQPEHPFPEKAPTLAALYEVSEGKPFRIKDMCGIGWQDVISRHLTVTRASDNSIGRALGRLLGSAGGFELRKHRDSKGFCYVVIKCLTT